ncbi:MAG: hypothetical protein K8F91_05230, partial [Candidatus Obscuribacterales bacterium]|nr:hypothetical protein [Candidatus Obscuribacterales bacterium]
LAGSESEKKMAIIAISTLTNPETGARIAQLFPSTGTVSALQSIAFQGSKKEKEVAKKALAKSFKTLGETSEVHSLSNSDAEGFYKQALDVQNDVYGTGSAESVDTLVKLARVNEKQGKLDDAISGYEKARQIMLNHHREKTLDFRTVLTFLSRSYRAQGKISLADDFASRAERLGADLSGTPSDINDDKRMISTSSQSPPVPLGEDTNVKVPAASPGTTLDDIKPATVSTPASSINPLGSDGSGMITAGSTSLMSTSN